MSLLAGKLRFDALDAWRALADMLVSWEDVHAYSLDDLVQVRTALAPVTLWNKFKDLQKKGKCLTAQGPNSSAPPCS